MKEARFGAGVMNVKEGEAAVAGRGWKEDDKHCRSEHVEVLLCGCGGERFPATDSVLVAR